MSQSVPPKLHVTIT